MKYKSPEESAKEILGAVLKETPLQPQNLVETIAQRFADFGNFGTRIPGNELKSWERVK